MIFAAVDPNEDGYTTVVAAGGGVDVGGGAGGENNRIKPQQRAKTYCTRTTRARNKTDGTAA